MPNNQSNKPDSIALLVKWFVGGVFVVTVILGLRALAIMSDFNAFSYRLANAGWGKLAEIIVQNKITALWHAALLAVCAGVFIWLFCWKQLRDPRLRLALRWILVLVVALDAFLLSRHYIKTMPLKAFEENDVIRVLKSDLAERRVALMSQDGFYNMWLTFLFPYHRIRTINVTQMPRLPADYKKFFDALGNHPLRYWQLAAVGFVLAPAQGWMQIQNDPAMKDAFDLVYAYNVKPADYYVEVIPATAEQPGQHVIMRLKKPAPRFALVGKWEAADDGVVLRNLSSTNYPLFEKVFVAPECAAGLPPSSGASEGNQVQVLDYRPGKIRLRTSSSGPALLRFSEKYDPDWRAFVDDKEKKVLRADFIFQGVLLEPGMHEVLLQYAPSTLSFWVQSAGFLVVAGAAGFLIAKKKNHIEQKRTKLTKIN